MTRTLALTLALLMTFALTMGGCKRKPQAADPAANDRIVVEYEDGNGYVQWVDETQRPAKTYALANVASMQQFGESFLIQTADEIVYIVPRHRLVYAGVQLP